MEKQGNIRIASENMMPIIKKWLYSEKDIFLREIVANAQDAITKHQKLVDLGEAEKEEHYRVTVTTDPKAGTLTVEDNGIGLIGILGLLDSPSLQENLKRIGLGLIQLTPIGLYKILHFPLLLMAASSVFSISMETVISPTPPGTGVIETSRSLKES